MPHQSASTVAYTHLGQRGVLVLNAVCLINDDITPSKLPEVALLSAVLQHVTPMLHVSSLHAF